MADKNKVHTRYLWIDLEMTGLDVTKERIIEVAAIATDAQLNPLGTYEAIVKQPKILLDQMDDWNQKHHSQSGLLAKIPSGKEENFVEKELIQFCKEHIDEPLILAGNTIGQDRLFLEKYFPEFSKLLHYRQLDVTAFKLAFLPLGIEFKKKNSHRALEDIQESLAEFKFFMAKLKQQS